MQVPQVAPMTSPVSDSDTNDGGSAFLALHPALQRWIWQQHWTELREVQERAIPVVLRGERDVILAAATAGGKTEAAFLPILSVLAGKSDAAGVACLCVSPLKALINDQARRLEPLGGVVEVPVHRWHGDVPATLKRQLRQQPRGVLLITPESLEGLFVLHGSQLARFFGALRYAVIDELHAFIATERGRQLQSLLQRVEGTLQRSVPRIGLSATLGDMALAAEFLRPGAGARVATIVDAQEGAQELKLQLRGYRTPPPRPAADTRTTTAENHDDEDRDIVDVCGHLFTALRGKDNLVFANSRGQVERIADLLRRRSAEQGVPNEFEPHHGSLAKAIREDVEARLKRHDTPTTAVCTSTLELGIDIGSVACVAQVGAPPTVASLRQRLGRSGRRGEPAVLRLYAIEDELGADPPVQDAIRAETVQTIAMVQLLLDRWCEPPECGAFHFSTLVQQVLSSIAQRGGTSALDAWTGLCRLGPFRNVDRGMFALLLRGLGARDLVTQTHDGTLVLGLAGERLVNHYEFYAAFVTTEEFRIFTQGRLLGHLPVTSPVQAESHIVFAGQRWKVVRVDAGDKVIEVVPSPGGKPPRFEGTRGIVHDRIRQTMLAIYRGNEVPVYLDAAAQRLLREGRQNFRLLGLDSRAIVRDGGDVLLFPWRGDRVMDTVVAVLQAGGLRVGRDGVAIWVGGTEPGEVLACLERATAPGQLDGAALACAVANKAQEKHDALLPDALLDSEFVARRLDVAGALQWLREVCADERGHTVDAARGPAR